MTYSSLSEPSAVVAASRRADAVAAGALCAAYPGGGFDIVCVARAAGGGGGRGARRRDDRRDADQEAHQAEDHDGQALGVDACQFRRLGVAAGGEDVAAEACAARDERHDQRDGERDQHRDRITGREDEAIDAVDDLVGGHADRLPGSVLDSRRDRDAILDRVPLRDAWRIGIGVDHRRDAEHRGAADEDRQGFRPYWLRRELELQALAPARDDREADEDAGDTRNDPAPQRADRSGRTVAADQLERLVHRRNRDSARNQKADAAERDEATQRDDEAGHLGISNQYAIHETDERAEGERKDHRHDPNRRMADAHIGPKDEYLQHAGRDRDDAEHRPHGQVDLAEDDHQHHAGRHHGDHGGLDQQRPEVARREERPAEQAATPRPHDAARDVETDPDNEEGTDHAQHAGIDLECPQEALHGVLVRRGWASDGRVRHPPSPVWPSLRPSLLMRSKAKGRAIYNRRRGPIQINSARTISRPEPPRQQRRRKPVPW